MHTKDGNREREREGENRSNVKVVGEVVDKSAFMLTEL
jgi:hypothetical protein